MAKKRRGKYYTHVEPKLFLVECWARDGLIDEQIAKNLGIAYSTFRDYKNKHLALSAALKKGKEVIDYEVENSLLKKAMGYNAEVAKTIKVKKVYYDEQGRRCEKEQLKETVDEVHIPADTTAQIFWLKNRRPDKWRDKPAEDTDANGLLEDLIKGIKQDE